MTSSKGGSVVLEVPHMENKIIAVLKGQEQFNPWLIKVLSSLSLVLKGQQYGSETLCAYFP